MSNLKRTPYFWQEVCLSKWFANGRKGIVRVVTGGGKTVLALSAIAALEEKEPDHRLCVKIIVPKIFLMRQWAVALQEELSVSRDEIGFYYGKQKAKKKYMIYVVNSARYALARHILSDMQEGNDIFLIADECHHYGSPENRRMFDFFPYMPHDRFYAMGLSATPETAGEGIALDQYLGTEIYSYGFTEAREARIICDFSLYDIGVDLTGDEQLEYDELNHKIMIFLPKLLSLCPFLKQMDGVSFFARVQTLCKNKNRNIAFYASGLLRFLRTRTALIYCAEARYLCACSLLERLDKSTRVLIFGERIAGANRLYEDLTLRYPGEVGKYHSKMSEASKRVALEQYQSGAIRILVSCKALDEGLNVPQTDVGIILSGTGNRRQKIQRLGRILRQTEDTTRMAMLYRIVVNQSSEWEESTPFSEVYRLYYDFREDRFVFAAYESLCRIANERMRQKGATALQLEEADKNMQRGMLRGDFMRSEENCLDQIRTSSTQKDRNYWISTLFLIRAARTNNETKSVF